MSSTAQAYDVIVVGAGVGGVCAALAAARSGARTALVERAPQIGGTGVHSPVSLICKFHARDHRPINMGIHRELFPHAYLHSSYDKRATAKRLTYDEAELAQRYQQLIAAETNLHLHTGSGVISVQRDGARITSITLANGSDLSAPVFIDSTADGNLAAMAGCAAMKGRESDGALQSATLVFTLAGIDHSKLSDPDLTTRGGLNALWKELSALYRVAKAQGATSNPRNSVLCFAYPDGKRLLFNSNEVLGVDPTVPGSVDAAKAQAAAMVDELVAIVKQHPALEQATVESTGSWMGIREGRRVLGDYVLSEGDCLGQARFDDMVAACAYEIDIHDPEGGPARMVEVPGSGYYHIPYRSLVAKDASNLGLGSRCISGTHEAHSSYRVMSGVSAIGQAIGTAAALAARDTDGDLRAVPAAQVRYVLREQLQFVEGAIEQPAGWDTPMV